MSILDRIVAQKRLEINTLYEQHDLDRLRGSVPPTQRAFHEEVGAARAAERPFFICEFKRKSPSEGWINQHADLPAQIRAYAEGGAGAISVLTDTEFFGGTYDDLRSARATLNAWQSDTGRTPPLLLQKDFVIDPIQIYLARQAGADLILLIASILEPDHLEALRQTALSLGMGALVEVHDEAELTGIRHLPFPVLGVNNRDLRTFRTALNRVNVVARQADGRLLISESGLHDYRDFAAVSRSDGFLIGTSLMRQGAASLAETARRRPLVKACGIRTAELLHADVADFLGVNFSPVSKRQIPLNVLENSALPHNAVAVFYQNSEADIRDVLARFPFRRVQLYAGDVTPEFVQSLKQKVILACRVRSAADLAALDAYAGDVDFFILDGPAPGSGQAIGEADWLADFPYPFLLAGGITPDNAGQFSRYAQCLGVDVASGIETDGVVDRAKIEHLRRTVDG